MPRRAMPERIPARPPSVFAVAKPRFVEKCPFGHFLYYINVIIINPAMANIIAPIVNCHEYFLTKVLAKP